MPNALANTGLVPLHYSSTNAVTSAGKGAPQLFTDAILDGVTIQRALIDTGSTFSMIPESTLRKHPGPPKVQLFSSPPPEIVGVGGSACRVRGYIDVPLGLAGVEVAHPLVVVDELPFPLLVGMDVLRPHAAALSLEEPMLFRLQTRYCDTCLEPRFTSTSTYSASPLVAYTVGAVSIKPMSATVVTVRLPPSVCASSEFVVDPLMSLILTYGCAVLPSVCSSSDGSCRVAIGNPSKSTVEFCASLPVASIHAVRLAPMSTSACAQSTSRLSQEDKLRKVVRELKLDDILDSAPHKSALYSRVAQFIDVFAESDSDVGTTNLVFHEIDTADCRPLRQPARRIPYGEMRATVESEITKLVDAGIGRKSTSPWASPVVMVRKKDGGWRMCVDYRRLNANTKFDCFPLPRLDEALDSFSGAVVFSSLDLAMAYHQVPVDPADVGKTAFVTHVGLFEMV